MAQRTDIIKESLNAWLSWIRLQKYSLRAIVVIGAMFFAFTLLMRFVFPFSYVIPDISVYPHNITFSASPCDTLYGPYMWNRPRRSYTSMKWESKDPKTASRCPIGVIIGGKSWAFEDFEWDRFIEAGAIDEFEEYKRNFGPNVTPAEIPRAYLLNVEANVRISCTYTKDKNIKEVHIFTQPRARDRQGLQVPQPEFQVTTPQGTVILPADHPTLVGQLGKPLKHTPSHIFSNRNGSL